MDIISFYIVVNGVISLVMLKLYHKYLIKSDAFYLALISLISLCVSFAVGWRLSRRWELSVLEKVIYTVMFFGYWIVGYLLIRKVEEYEKNLKG